MSERSLYRLMSWLSPAFPTGSFAHSGGLEWAIAEGFAGTRSDLEGWLEDFLTAGGGRNDAVLFVHAWHLAARREQESLNALVELAAALHPSRERWLEAVAQGAAFRRIALSTAPCDALAMLAAIPDEELCYPIVVAVLAAGHAITPATALTGYLHAVIGNLVSAAQRLIPLGQTDGQKVIAALEPEVHRLAQWALTLPGSDPFEQIGSATLMADFASLAHETQYTRLFRT